MLEKNEHYYNYALFVLLAVFWSGSFLGIKIAVANFPPVFSAMLRVLIAQFFLTIVFLLMRKKLTAPFSVCWRLWIVGIFTQGLPFALLFCGEKTVEPALASILNSTVSIWAFIFGLIIFRAPVERISQKITGLILGIVGVACIFWPMLSAHKASGTMLGTILILLMAMSYAVGALLNQHFVGVKIKPGFQASLWQQHWASMIFLLVVSCFFEPHPVWQHFFVRDVWGALLYLGLFSTGIAWLIYFHLIREWDAVRASSVMYVVPLLAILWDYLFLHLKPSLPELAGVGMILGGVILLQWQRPRKI